MNKKDSLSDERLVSLHQQKRVNAFFILYNRYKNYTYSIIYHTLEKGKLVNALKDEKDAILYDSIMEAIKIFDKKRGTFRKLLSAIVENQTLNYIRKFKRDPLSDYVSLDVSNKESGELLFADSLTFADKSASPSELINLDENAKKVKSNYDGAHKRKINQMIQLKMMGYSSKEIAKQFNMTHDAVRALFYRIKKRLDVKDNNKIKK